MSNGDRRGPNNWSQDYKNEIVIAKIPQDKDIPNILCKFGPNAPLCWPQDDTIMPIVVPKRDP